MNDWIKTLDKIVEIFRQPVETAESLELIDQYWIFTLAVEHHTSDAPLTREVPVRDPAVMDPPGKRS